MKWWLLSLGTALLAFGGGLTHAQQNENVAPGTAQGDYGALEDEFAAFADVRETDRGDYSGHRYHLIVDAFERVAGWKATIPSEVGHISLRRLHGAATPLRDGTSFIGTPRGRDNGLYAPSYRTADGRYEIATLRD